MSRHIAFTIAIFSLSVISSAFADVKGRTGSAMKLLGINSSGETVSTAPLAARKNFNLRGKKAERVFGLVNNVFTGQLVSYTYNGKSINYSKLVRKGYCENDNEDVAFADPGTLLDLALDPAHAFHAIVAADADMVCPHHQLCTGKLFIELLFGQADSYYRRSVGIEIAGTVRGVRFFYSVWNCSISITRIQGREI